MKEKKLVVTLSALLVNSMMLFAVVDMEKEIYAPAAEMKMLDDAMNKGIKEQEARNQAQPMVIENEISFTESPALEFVDNKDAYVLEKHVADINNTEVTATLENRMLTVKETQKVEKTIKEGSVSLGTSSTRTEFFESTTSESLSLPDDADEKTFVSDYSNGLLRVSVQKK